MPFIIDKFKSKNGASVSEEFALFDGVDRGVPYPHFPPPFPPLPSPSNPTSLPLSDFSLPLIKVCSCSWT